MTLSGTPLDYLIAFAGGLLMSLTPCAYPLIPIAAGFIGVESCGTKLKGFLLSFTYVSGVAFTYSILGIVTTLTGNLFGSFSTKPLTQIITGLVIIFFGISMLDVFSLSLPQVVRISKFKKHNYFYAFLLGMVSGLTISPCLTPVLGGILVYIATKESVFYGATLLISFAYGMGLIFIVIGTFSAILMKLPKSGAWMNIFKKIAAFILLLVGFYFLFKGIRRMS